MTTIEQIEIAREQWSKASQSFVFKFISPYFIEINAGQKEVFAFLPEYGSLNGAVVCLTSAPNYETDPDVISWAKENKFFYSFINVENCQRYDESYFRELLDDWMKY